MSFQTAPFCFIHNRKIKNMARIKIHKKFLSIPELITRWECTAHDIQYIIEDGEIRVYIRPVAVEAAISPLFSFTEEDKIRVCPISAIDVHRAFSNSQGTTTISFNEQTVNIVFSDLIILTEDIEQYEKTHSDAFVLLSPDYRQFMIRGQLITMGTKQAAVVRYLHERSQTDNPWVHGKELMKLAGSESWKIQNLFGGHKNWRAAITSDGRGYYKLNI